MEGFAGLRPARGARAVLPAARSAAGKRARWGILDQGFSSATNFGITTVAARQSTPVQFGAFSVGLAIYIFLLWVARALVTEPFMVRFSSSPFDDRQAAARRVVGASITIGGVAAVGIVGAALWFDGTLRSVLVVIALSMPGLLAQDAYRYLLIGNEDARSASFNDLVWLIVQSVFLVGLFMMGLERAGYFIAAFGLAGSLSAVVGARQTRVLPSLALSWRWIRDHRDLGVPYLIELVAVNGVVHLALLVIATFGGVIAVGELRAAMLLLSPPTVLISGVFLMGIPEAVRLKSRSVGSLRKFVVGFAVATSFMTLAWVGGLFLVPESIGVRLLRSSWTLGRHSLLPVAALTVGNACVLGAVIGLRALADATDSLRARLAAGPVIILAGVVGTKLGGPYGAGVGLAAGTWFSAFLAWAALLRALTKAERVPGKAQAELPARNPAEVDG